MHPHLSCFFCHQTVKRHVYLYCGLAFCSKGCAHEWATRRDWLSSLGEWRFPILTLKAAR